LTVPLQLSEVRSENLRAVFIEGLNIKLTLMDGTTFEFHYPSEETLSAALWEWAFSGGATLRAPKINALSVRG